MSFLEESHSKFVQTSITSAQFLPSSIYSAIPSFIFFVSSFILLYEHIHRNTTGRTKWTTRLVRDFKFHWIYFNATRLWYLFMSCFRKLLAVAEDYVETYLDEKDINLTVTHSAAAIFVTTLAIFPIFLIYVNYCTTYDMPNFLMWVMEDPYLRHEIGISGHCLERPLRIDTKKMRNYSYRSGRSTSFDSNPWLHQPPNLCRSSRSMTENPVVNSVEDLLDK